MSEKAIRFIDSEYRELFNIPDGGNIKIVYPAGDDRGTLIRQCKFLDEYHTEIGNNVYHICEFAERMEAIGARYEPEKQLENAEILIAAADESKMFYRNKEDAAAIGICSGDFGNGDRLHYNVGDYGNGNNTPEFRADLYQVMFELQKGLLRDFSSMAAYCETHPGARLPGDYVAYGFKMETQDNRYFIRCNPVERGHFGIFCFQKGSFIERSREYIDKHYTEFCEDKFYVDREGARVQNVYYNPDSSAGGQLVYNDICFDVLKEAFKECKTEEQFWGHLDTFARQTLSDIDTLDFAGDAKDFAEKPCDYTGRGKKTMLALKKLIAPTRDIPDSAKTPKNKGEAR